jgi:hypothetical protein
MALATHGKVSVPISYPTILQYGHAQSQLKCAEADVCIQNNNSAQFSVTDVHYDKDFSGGTQIPVRCYATVPNTQPLHTVTVYSSQTYLPRYIQQSFYTMTLVHCTLQNAKTSIYKRVTCVCVFFCGTCPRKLLKINYTCLEPTLSQETAMETPRVIQFTSCC